MSNALLQAAIEMATKAHAGTWRDGDDPLPYITHPIEVMLNLRFVGGITDCEMLCAAALHDTVEADALTLDEIGEVFGARVRSLVAELTRNEPDTTTIANMSRDEIWALRSGMLLEEISKMSSDAQQVKLADRLANVRDAIRTKSGKKLKRYLRQSETILQTVPKPRNKALWEEIDHAIKEN